MNEEFKSEELYDQDITPEYFNKQKIKVLQTLLDLGEKPEVVKMLEDGIANENNSNEFNHTVLPYLVEHKANIIGLLGTFHSSVKYLAYKDEAKNDQSK